MPNPPELVPTAPTPVPTLDDFLPSTGGKEVTAFTEFGAMDYGTPPADPAYPSPQEVAKANQLSENMDAQAAATEERLAEELKAYQERLEGLMGTPEPTPWIDRNILAEPFMGVAKAVKQTTDVVQAILSPHAGTRSFIGPDGQVIWQSGSAIAPFSARAPKPTSSLGSFTREGTAFLTEYLALRKAGAVLGVLRGGSKARMVVEEIAVSGLASGIVWDGSDATLGEHLGLIDYGMDEPPEGLSGYLAGRAKHAIEDAPMTLFGMGIFKGLGKIATKVKAYKALKGAEAAAEATAAARNDLEEAVAEGLEETIKGLSKEEAATVLSNAQEAAARNEIGEGQVKLLEDIIEDAFPVPRPKPVAATADEAIEGAVDGVTEGAEAIAVVGDHLNSNQLRKRVREINKAEDKAPLVDALQDELLDAIDEGLVDGNMDGMARVLDTLAELDKSSLPPSLVDRVIQAAEGNATPLKGAGQVSEAFDEAISKLKSSRDALNGVPPKGEAVVDLVPDRPLTKTEIAKSADNVLDAMDDPLSKLDEALANGIPAYTAKAQMGALEAGVHTTWKNIYSHLQHSPDKYFKPVSLDSMATRAKDLGDLMGVQGKDVVEELRKVTKQAEELPYLIAAVDRHAKDLTRQMDAIGKKIVDGTANEADLVEFSFLKEELPEIINSKKITDTLVGRSMNSYRLQATMTGRGTFMRQMRASEAYKASKTAGKDSTVISPMMTAVKQDSGSLELIMAGGAVKRLKGAHETLDSVERSLRSSAEEIITFYGGREAVMKEAQKYTAARTQKTLAEFRESATAAKWDNVMAYYVNNYIATPAGAAINFVSTAMNSVAQPVYRIVGGAIVTGAAKMAGKQEAAMQAKRVLDEGVSWLVGIGTAMQDFRSIWESGMASQHFGNPGKKVTAYQEASHGAISSAEDSITAATTAAGEGAGPKAVLKKLAELEPSLASFVENGTIRSVREARDELYKNLMKNSNVPLPPMVLQQVGDELRAPSFRPDGWFGKYLIPLRAFGASDEIFKQITYRASAYARSQTLAGDALIEAMGKANTLKQAGKELPKELRGIFAKEGQDRFLKEHSEGLMTVYMSEPSLFGKEFIDKAYTAAYQQDPPFFAKAITAIRQSSPGVGMLTQLIFPFVRIPSNIIRESVRLTPQLAIMEAAFDVGMGLFNRSGHKSALLGHMGPEEMVARIGQYASGVSLALMGYGLYKNGNLTGSGPMDPSAKAVWKKENQEHALRIGSLSIPLGRLDPFFQVMSVQADACRASEELYKEGLSKQAWSMILKVFPGSVIDQSWAVPAKNMLEVLQANRSPTTIADQIMSGFVPYQSFGRQLNKAITGTLPDYKEDLVSVRSGTLAPFMWAVGLQPNPSIDIISNDPLHVNFWEALFPGAGGGKIIQEHPTVGLLGDMAVLPSAMKIPLRLGSITLTTDERALVAKYRSELRFNGKDMLGVLGDITKRWNTLPAIEKLSVEATRQSPQYMQLQTFFGAVNQAAMAKLATDNPEFAARLQQDSIATALLQSGRSETVSGALTTAETDYMTE